MYKNVILLFIIIFFIKEKTNCQTVIDYFPQITDSISVPYPSNVRCMEIYGDMVCIGGQFKKVGNSNRKYLACIKITDGQIAPLNSILRGQVIAMTIHQGYLFYTTSDQTTVISLGCIDIATGNNTSWQPSITSNDLMNPPFVSSMVSYNNHIFISGSFDHVNGNAASQFVILDASTGLEDGYYNVLKANLKSTNCDKMFIKDSILYLPLCSLSFNLSNGQKTNWSPNPSPNPIEYFSFDNNSMYMGGGFTSVGNKLRNGFAQVDLNNGNPSSWNPDCGPVKFILAARSCVYVQRSNFLETYDKTINTKIDTWLLQGINVMASYGDTAIIGGQFSKLGWVNRKCLVAVCKGLSLGVNEVNNALQKISVFPNPTNNKISFSLNETNNKTLNIIITNILGETVFNNTLNYQKEIEIPVTDLNNGLYFIKVQSGNNTYAGKFVKE